MPDKWSPEIAYQYKGLQGRQIHPFDWYGTGQSVGVHHNGFYFGEERCKECDDSWISVVEKFPTRKSYAAKSVALT